MKQSLDRATLAYHLGVRPGLRLRDMSHAPIKGVVANLNRFMEGDNFLALSQNPTSLGFTAEGIMGTPEKDALMFYMLNHALSIVRQRVHPYENLGAYLPVVEAFHWNLAYRSARMFYYLLLICTRESRHERQSHDSPFWLALIQKYGKPVADFQLSIHNSSSSTAGQQFRSSPPDIELGPYTKYLAEVFHHGKFPSHYGGPAWGAIADVLRDYCIGKTTAEMMMDTAFTLAHNTNAIFNKGMLFTHHSSDLVTILDVQRAGQIPQLIAEKKMSYTHDADVHKAWTLCSEALGDCFSGHIDWFLVEELGAVNKYTSQKNDQVKKYGYPSKFKAKLESENAKKELKLKQEQEDAPMYITIMPGVQVKKEKRA